MSSRTSDSTTTREQFRALAAEHRVVPVTRKVLADRETPLSTYRKLAADRPGTFLLESAENGRSWSRWSFIGAGAPTALTVVDGDAAWLGETPADAPAGGDPLAALRETSGGAGDRAAAGPAAADRRAGRLLRLRHGPPAGALPEHGGRRPAAARTWCCCWPPTSPPSTTTRAPITLIANAVNWNGTDERVDEAYDDAVARLDVMTEALGAPAPSTVATFNRPEPELRRSAAPRSTAPIVRSLVGEIEAGEAFQVVLVAAVRDGHRRPTRSTCTGCCGCPTPARTCIC